MGIFLNGVSSDQQSNVSSNSVVLATAGYEFTGGFTDRTTGTAADRDWETPDECIRVRK